MKLRLLTTAILGLLVSYSYAQQGMGIGNNNPQEMLDVSGAIKLGSTTNTNTGTIRWNGTNFQGYDGTQWVNLDGSGGTGTDDQNLTGATLTGTSLQIDIEDGTSTSVNLDALVDDADADASNELQTLSISGSDITLSNGGGTVAIPAGGDSDWTVSGNNQYSAVSGNVGIGLTNPGAPLHIKKDQNGQTSLIIENDNTSGFSTERISFNNEDGSVAGISVHDNDSGAYPSQMRIFNNRPSSSVHLINSGNPADNSNLSLIDGGNVGIGTLTPEAKLEVNGQVKITGGAPGAGKVLTSDGVGLASWTTLTADGDGDSSNEIQNLTSTVSGTNRTINISSGTGTTISVADNDNNSSNELQTLSISGSTISLNNGGGSVTVPNDGDWTVSGNDQYSTVSGNVGIGTTNPQQKLTLSDANTPVFRLDRSATNAWDWEMYSTSGYLSFRGGSDNVGASLTDRLTILGDGNVGVGTTSADALLNVAGTSHFEGVSYFEANVGVGTASPQQGLTVSDDNTPVLRMDRSGANAWDWEMYSTSGGLLSFRGGSNNVGASLADRLTILGDGNVGIGTTTPAAKLDINGTGALNDNQLRLRAGNDANHYLSFIGGAFDGAKLTGNNNVILNTITGGDALIVTGNRVGIGTPSPIAPLHVESTASPSYGNFTYYAFQGNAGGGSCCAGTVNDVSIHSAGRVMATEFDAFSDARIKKVVGTSNSFEDLSTLLDIEITDYTMIDKAKDVKPYKKVIAQQVEEVYPSAVSQITDVVPDIYTVSAIKNGFVSLKTDLEKGDKVRLIFDEGTEMATVTSTDENGFTVDLEKTGNVFVYGREVDDFRTVDYEAISMLNVSATQELFKMIEELKSRNSNLEEKLSDYSSLKNDVELLKEALGIDLQTKN